MLLYQEKSFKKLVSLSLCSATHSVVSWWWIRQFHSSEPRASLLPSHKPWRAGRDFLSFLSGVCERDRLPVPPSLFPSSLPPAPLLEAASGTTEVQGLTPYSCMSLSSRDPAGAQLQRWESREAGMLTHTLNPISSVTGDINKTVSKSQRGDLSWLEENPCWGRAVSGNAEPVVAGSCLAAAGTALWHLRVSASALSHTSGHWLHKGCKRTGVCVESRVKALFSSSLSS